MTRIKNPLGKGTISKGGLHRSLNVPQGQKIPASKMAAARAGKYGPKAKKQANMAKGLATVRNRRRRK